MWYIIYVVGGDTGDVSYMSTKEGIFFPCVDCFLFRFSVVLSICLLAKLLKKLLAGFDEICRIAQE